MELAQLFLSGILYIAGLTENLLLGKKHVSCTRFGMLNQDL